MRWTIRTIDKYGIEIDVEYDKMPDFLRGTVVMLALIHALQAKWVCFE
jgi:hypothetical protein